MYTCYAIQNYGLVQYSTQNLFVAAFIKKPGSLTQSGIIRDKNESRDLSRMTFSCLIDGGCTPETKKYTTINLTLIHAEYHTDLKIHTEFSIATWLRMVKFTQN